jgi:hypothetical protein
MNKRIVVMSVAGVSVAAVSTFGIVSAAPSHMASTTIGSSGISRTVFREERLAASAEVLNTSTANVQAAHKAKDVSTLITNAGLTKKTFQQKLKAELTSDLEAKGYSQTQVTIALQHRLIVHVRHDHKKTTSATTAPSGTTTSVQ